MNTITNNNSAPRGVHRGIWIGGGLMAVTIVALATALVVRSNHADTAAADALASPSAASSAPMDASSAPATPLAQATTSPDHDRRHHHEHPGNGGVGGDGASGSPSYVNESTLGNSAPQQVASVAACTACGVIDSYSTVTVQGQNNGVGAVAGGVGGALIGSKIAGRGNHTLGGIIGAVGGGLLGNAVESHERRVTAYDVHVRMSDGSIRTVRQATLPQVGAHVRIDGNTLVADTTQG